PAQAEKTGAARLLPQPVGAALVGVAHRHRGMVLLPRSGERFAQRSPATSPIVSSARRMPLVAAPAAPTRPAAVAAPEGTAREPCVPEARGPPLPCGLFGPRGVPPPGPVGPPGRGPEPLPLT